MSISRFTRSKEDYGELLTATIQRVGPKLVLKGFELDQQLDTERMVNVPMRTDECHLLLQRLPRDYNNPEGIQRAYKLAKIDEIAEESRNKPNYTAPGSIVGALDIDSRPWVKVTFQHDRSVYIEVDLQKMQRNFEVAASSTNFREEDFKIGYMIDAHHRTEGHLQAGRQGLEMASVLYVGLKPKDMARIFTGVNQKQEKPSPVHVLAMREMAGLLEGDEETALEIIKQMEDDASSVLHRRIKVIDGKRPRDYPRTYVNMSAFTKFLQSDVIPNISSQTLAERTDAIENYFQAWSRVFPDAWQDEKDHVLVKSMGFSIICGLFKSINSMTQVLANRVLPSSSDYEQTIRYLQEVQIPINSITMPLDWTSTKFGGLSSGKGINFLKATIEAYLTQNKARILNLS